jgi:bacterioferritin
MEELIALLIEALNDEWHAALQYMIQSSMVRGLLRDPIADHLKEHGDDEVGHAEKLAIHLYSRGIPVNIEVPPVSVPEKIPEMIQQDLNDEVKAIDRYACIIEMVEGNPQLADTRILIEDLLLDEIGHQDEAAAYLRAKIASREEAVGAAGADLAIADQSDRLASIVWGGNPEAFVRRADFYTEEARRLTAAVA